MLRIEVHLVTDLIKRHVEELMNLEVEEHPTDLLVGNVHLVGHCLMDIEFL